MKILTKRLMQQDERVLPGEVGGSGNSNPDKSLLLEKELDGNMEVTENKAILKRQRYITPEILLEEFSAEFLDNEYCRQWILRKLHPEGPYCPDCKASLTGKCVERFWMAERVKCPHCGKYFTALTDTFLSGTHMNFKEMILLILFLGIGCSSAWIAKYTDNDEETIRIWRKKFEILEKIRTITNNG